MPFLKAPITALFPALKLCRIASELLCTQIPLTADIFQLPLLTAWLLKPKLLRTQKLWYVGLVLSGTALET